MVIYLLGITTSQYTVSLKDPQRRNLTMLESAFKMHKSRCSIKI